MAEVVFTVPASFFPAFKIDPSFTAEFWRLVSTASLKQVAPEWLSHFPVEMQPVFLLSIAFASVTIIFWAVRYFVSPKELDITKVPVEVQTYFPYGEGTTQSNFTSPRLLNRRASRLKEPRLIVPPRDYEPEVILFMYNRPTHIPVANASPFCLKLETFCRISGIPYKISKMPFMEYSPKGRMPFAFLRDQYVGDSDFIIKAIQADPTHFGGVDVDSYLTDQQKAMTQLLTDIFEGSIYHLNLYYLWIRLYNTTWRHLLSDMPLPIAWMVARKIHQDSLLKCSANGLLDHNDEEIDLRTVEKIEAISSILGTNKYFVGLNATVIDCIAYANLAIPLLLPFDTPLRLAIAERVNLVEFVESMTEEFYPEFLENVVAIAKSTKSRKRARSRASSQARGLDSKTD